MPDNLFPSDQERAWRRHQMAIRKAKAQGTLWRTPKHDTHVSPFEVPPLIPAWQLDFTKRESPEQ